MTQLLEPGGKSVSPCCCSQELCVRGFQAIPPQGFLSGVKLHSASSICLQKLPSSSILEKKKKKKHPALC